MSTRNRTIATLAAALLLLAGCVVPSAVRQFTAMAKDATAQFPPLVRDLTASCIRKQLADRPPDEIADVGEQTRAACKAFADLEPRLLDTLGVLVNYFNALNHLASDDIVTYDKEIDGLAANIQTAGAFQNAQVKAVKGLAGFLAKAAASGYQRKKLAEDLKAADASVAVLCDALARVAGEDYVRLLENEENALRSRYRDAIQADPAKKSAVALLLQESWRRDLNALNQKRSAAHDVQTVLAKIRDGHKALAAQAGHWNAREVVETIAPYTVSIQGLMTDFRTAF